MILSGVAARVSLRGAPSFCSRKKWKREEMDASARWARK